MVIGAGASGVGLGVLLEELNIKNYIIIEKGSVGQSFINWPKETKFISPSFTSNMFMQPDLNAISPLTSPAYSFNKQHPSGEEYATYLKLVSDEFKLKIKEETEVLNIVKNSDDIFEVSILENKKESTLKAKYLAWAGGEFSFPKKDLFEGYHLGQHTSQIDTYKNLKFIDDAGENIIIGGGESAYDLAYNLTLMGKVSVIIEKSDTLKNANMTDDPSKKLSPVTIQKIDSLENKDLIKVKSGSRVNKIEYKDGEYVLTLENKKQIITKNKPFLATGFQKVPDLISKFIKTDKNNDLDLNNFDESRAFKNIFFIGPNIHRENVILCFIYKYRMRFAIVALEIAKRLKTDKAKVSKIKNHYKKYNMYLEDISSCDTNCTCG